VHPRSHDRGHRSAQHAVYPSHPAAPATTWRTFVETIGNLSYTEWSSDLERARLWYEPHLDRIHDDAEVRRVDLIQLEQIAGAQNCGRATLTLGVSVRNWYRDTPLHII
jgi:hypothetical protein